MTGLEELKVGHAKKQITQEELTENGGASHARRWCGRKLRGFRSATMSSAVAFHTSSQHTSTDDDEELFIQGRCHNRDAVATEDTHTNLGILDSC
jgi:hypothetical protein